MRTARDFSTHVCDRVHLLAKIGLFDDDLKWQSHVMYSTICDMAQLEREMAQLVGDVAQFRRM
jgi:hypothetical protein